MEARRSLGWGQSISLMWITALNQFWLSAPSPTFIPPSSCSRPPVRMTNQLCELINLLQHLGTREKSVRQYFFFTSAIFRCLEMPLIWAHYIGKIKTRRGWWPVEDKINWSFQKENNKFNLGWKGCLFLHTALLVILFFF